MKPDWDRLATEYKDSTSLLIADVDCTAAGRDLCERHSVTGYPTLKTIQYGKVVDYSGARTPKALRSHINSLAPWHTYLAKMPLPQKIALGLVVAFVVYVGGQVGRLW